MPGALNAYCDESCHLEHDGHRAMVLGAVWCPTDKAREINRRIREVVAKYNLSPNFEIKWKKVSVGRQGMYKDLVDYFFDDDDLHFRAVVVPDKTCLDHAAHEQTHDDWYYKMYFRMLEWILDPEAKNRIYLDYKDTVGGKKVRKLHDVLCNSLLDFSHDVIDRVQIVHSHEVPAIQLADLLIGAVGYANRGLTTNQAKVALVKRFAERSRCSLTRTTLLRAMKVNILRWRPKGADDV